MGNALRQLGRKKQYENKVEDIDKIMANMETMKDAVEQMQTNKLVIDAINSANKVLEQGQSVDEMADAIDDLKEQQDKVNEVQSLLTENWSGESYLDDQSLEDEFQTLLRLNSDELDLPTAPTTVPEASQNEDQVKALDDWANSGSQPLALS